MFRRRDIHATKKLKIVSNENIEDKDTNKLQHNIKINSKSKNNSKRKYITVS